MKNPRKNRMTPTGEMVADPSYGTFMGNRGILHDVDGAIGHRRWRHKNWIICRTQFKGRKRPVMAPNRYTELFFLDEATALAAGHRPCAECRRSAYDDYRAALERCGCLPRSIRAPELDNLLHHERAIAGTFRQKTWTAPIMDLPDGAMVEQDGKYLLVAGSWLLEWSFQGYRIGHEKRTRRDGPISVLTPKTSVAALAAGYTPAIHDTAIVLLASLPDGVPIFSKVAGQEY